MKMPDHINKEIWWKLALHVKPEHILDSICNIFNDREKRHHISDSDLQVCHVIKKKTILQMRRKMLLAEESRHEDDSTSVKYKVEAM